ncbi:MAG: hypothetical protein ACREH4_15685 [Vitreimonas sp.]
MINVTITMDEATARWLRVEAAKAGKSVSRFVGDMLAEQRAARGESGLTPQQEGLALFLSTPARDLGFYERAPKREEFYDEVLRRHERAVVREGSQVAYEAQAGAGVAAGPSEKKRRRAKRAKPA